MDTLRGWQQDNSGEHEQRFYEADGSPTEYVRDGDTVFSEETGTDAPQFCGQCGSALPDGDRFCGRCGRVVPPRSNHGLDAPVTGTPVYYDTDAWSNIDREKFTAELLNRGIPHRWNGMELSVDRQFESQVDEMQTPTSDPGVTDDPTRLSSGVTKTGPSRRKTPYGYTTDARWEKNRKTVFIGIVAVIVLGVIIASALGKGSGSGSGSGSSGSATYSTTLTYALPIDNQELSVRFQVTNTGSQSGTPSCGVTANSPGNADDGFDNIIPVNAIAPGQTITLQDTFTITNNGAYNISPSGVSVSCS